MSRRLLQHPIVAIISAAFVVGQATVPPSSPQASNSSHGSQVSSELEDVPLGEPFEWSLPKYPKDARKSDVQGDVVLVLTVDTEGNVTNASVVTGDPKLSQAATGAARKWKYVPYDVNGRPVVVRTKVVVRFSSSPTKSNNVSVAFEMPTVSPIGPVFSAGKGIMPPKVVSSPSPTYSKEALDHKYQGHCDLALVVGADGKPYDIEIVRPLGEGLDQKAIEAVRNWRFEPGRKDGTPVAVRIRVEVAFHLD